MAFARARHTADALLNRYRDEHGRYPRALALVLWGLDNIKTNGEGVAQALWLLGVSPVRDALNRVTEVEVIPLEELKRPRMDVVITVSGIFRDLFAPTMALLDKAVRRVATLDEPVEKNYLRRNVSETIDVDGYIAEGRGICESCLARASLVEASGRSRHASPRVCSRCCTSISGISAADGTI